MYFETGRCSLLYRIISLREPAMEIKKYKIIIIICLVMCLPVGLIQWLRFAQWKKSDSRITRLSLEKALTNGIVFVYVEIIIICFWFYHLGRNFIEVMGTFY